MSKRVVVWRIVDGKPGHENQSAGLIAALKPLLDLECVDVFYKEGKPDSARPDLLVGAGHKTHWKLLRWSIRYRAKSVVLMKPSLPMTLFDLCLVPEHDLKDGYSPRTNLIPTKGVLNMIRPGEKIQPPIGVILIGGASKEFDWDGATLEKAIHTIVSEDPEIDWVITDSRRTKEGFLQSLEGHFTKCPHQETERGWLPGKLSAATKCWVTEDSVSMIYEALTCGAKVGLLPMLRKGKPGRVAGGIQKLVDEGRVVRFGDASSTPPAFASLREADRCAKLLARKFHLIPKERA